MARAKFKFNDKKKFDKLIRELKKEVPKAVKESILRDIKGGRSPVKGEGRFKKYSSLYIKAIKSGKYSEKRIRPVNMKLTGKMLKSFYSKAKKKSLLIGFDDIKADYHNRLGAGKSKVIRRLLPTELDEEFNRSIQNDLKETLNRVAKRIFG